MAINLIMTIVCQTILMERLIFHIQILDGFIY